MMNRSTRYAYQRHAALVAIPFILSLWQISFASQPAASNLVTNPGFERGTRGWRGSWEDEGAEVVCDAGGAHGGRSFLVLTAEDANVGIDSEPLRAATDFDVGKPHLLSARVANHGITRGGFGLRFYCYDARGEYLAMKSLGNLGPKSAVAGWQEIEAHVGPGTDFPFPEGVGHVVVRFSFWADEADCRGQVLIDDVYFGPIANEREGSLRTFERTSRGAVAIWKDDLSAGEASEPDYLASLLRRAGFGVSLIDTDELADRAVLHTNYFDLVVLPYGSLYPATGADALRRFLRQGGGMISLGGPCFRRPVYPSPDGWIEEISSNTSPKPPRPIVELSQETAVSLGALMERGDQPAEVALSEDPDGNRALRVVVPDLHSYKYLPLTTESTADYSVVHFRARGDSDTRHLCVELNETEGSRWKAVVPLSAEWQTYEISTGEFISYATEGRGDEGDFFHSDRARRVAFGFPSSLVGVGRRSFEISQIEWRFSSVAPQQVASDSLLFAVSTDLVRAFGSDLKGPARGGDVTAFFDSEPFRGAAELRAAPGQIVFPEGLTVPGPISGSTATILEDNFYLLRKRESGHARQFLPTERLARSIPLLTTPEGQPAASLFVHAGGPYADGVWACFGATNRDLFPRDDPQAGQAFVALAERMLSGASLEAIEPSFGVRDGRACMDVFVDVLDHGTAQQKLELRSRLSSIGGEKSVRATSTRVQLCPGQSRRVLALEADADQFDWKRYRVECQLVADDRVIDRIETSVDVRSVLEAVCDRFVGTQQARGDGKFSGVGFVDNRGVRALLAAYDLFGKRAYLDAAIRWGDATLAEQRDDGGYLMGYGYHPDGNECFVADGGEIACAVARLVTYAPEPDRKRFIDSLRAYMAFRESFRCEGGGIGVGWCKHDYGQRPIRPLEKITQIYAPERNIYTIGCTLTAAIMHALLTKDPADHETAVRDAFWWMQRCEKTCGGAFVESAVWAHRFLAGDEIRRETEAFLREKFVPHVVEPESRWWTSGGGRTVQGLDGLAYYYDCVDQDPEVLAALMRATYHVCSPQALSGIPRVLAKEELSADEWRYLHFASVSLPNLLESEIVRKDSS